MTKIKAILFDMDGVLIDARQWHYEALNDALGIFGLQISRYDHLHTFDGLPTRVKLQLLSEQYYLPEKLHGFINEVKQKKTQQIINERCHPIKTAGRGDSHELPMPAASRLAQIGMKKC